MNSAPNGFLEMVRRDPLFAAEGLDVDSAKAAIDALEREIVRLQKTFSSYSFAYRVFFSVYPLRNAIPIDFLRSFVQSEISRRSYLKEQNDAAVQMLTRNWSEAARSLRKAVRRHALFLRFVLLREPTLKKKTFNDAAGNSFTFQDIERSVAALKKNAEAVIREAADRRRGIWSERVSRPVLIGENNATLSEADRYMEELEEERLSDRYDILERCGPVSFRLAHFDGIESTHQFKIFIARNRKTGEPYLSLFLADRHDFLPLGKNANYGRLSPSIFKDLVERGIRYFSQQLTWFYAMRDQQYYADALTLIDHIRRPGLDRALLNAQRSSLLDLILWRIVDDMRRYRQITKVRMRADEQKTFALGDSFIMQSHPSIYFLPFNWSVWRLSEPAFFSGGKRTESKNRRYVTLPEIQPPPTKEDLRSYVLSGYVRRQAWKEQGIDLED